MKHPLALSTLIMATAAAACSESRGPVEITEPSAVFGKTTTSVTSDCGGSTELRDSRADLTWPSISTREYAVRDDGFGTYEGGTGSVHGKIFYHDSGCSRSGDIVFDPGMNARKNPRHLTVFFPENKLGLPTDGVKAGPFINFTAAMQLGSDVDRNGAVNGRDAKMEAKDNLKGTIRTLEHPVAFDGLPNHDNLPNKERRFRLGVGISGCESLEYDEIRYTRIAGSFVRVDPASDGTLLGQWSDAVNGAWVAESVETVRNNVPGHWAQCLITSKGTLAVNDAASPMSMPFRVDVAERR